MRITLLGDEIGNPTSGQSRFLINIARGLRSEGHDVGVAAAFLAPGAVRELTFRGVRASALEEGGAGVLTRALRIRSGSHAGRRVALHAIRELPADWYVVLSDGVIDAIEALPQDRAAYISQGDIALMLTCDSFYHSHRFAKTLFAAGAVNLIRRNARLASRYRVLLGNSKFTRGFMSYLYSVPFTGVVYPPVDTEFFHPPTEGARHPRYVVSMARNSDEQGLEILRQIATLAELHVVGGARVAGAAYLGVVSDERLRTELGGASWTIAPVVSEFFGYVIAESLACGTPVLAYRSGGPEEQIQEGHSGWLVSSSKELLLRVRTLVDHGVPSTMRALARAGSLRYSIENSTRALLDALPEL